jgi:hypothetical protein
VLLLLAAASAALPGAAAAAAAALPLIRSPKRKRPRHLHARLRDGEAAIPLRAERIELACGAHGVLHGDLDMVGKGCSFALELRCSLLKGRKGADASEGLWMRMCRKK